MKRFLLVLVILFAAGGAGLFFGWVHSSVAPGEYGVVRSKTHGLDPQVVRDGEFRWLWYKLIPSNVRVISLPLERKSYVLSSSGALPSGDVYANLAGISADFSWEISWEISFALKPDALPELAAQENITSEADFRLVQLNLAARIENAAAQRLTAIAQRDDGASLEAVRASGTIAELERDLLAAFPVLESISCTIRTLRLPDYALYRQLKDLYRDYMERQTAGIGQNTAREAEMRVNMNMRLDELARYGELLTKYPILLQYLALEKNGFLLTDNGNPAQE
jgi:hypothetical protein